MKRSRRHTSRRLIGILALIIAISAVCIVRSSFHGSADARSAAQMPMLSALDVGSGATTAQTRPSVTAAVVVADPAPPIQTSTPQIAASAAVSAAPTPGPAPTVATPPATLPSASVAVGKSWSQLLSGGSADGAAPANLPPSNARPIVTGNGPFADAKARVAAGQLLEARSAFNEALQSSRLSDADALGIRSQISQINQTLVFSPRAFAGDTYVAAYPVQRGDSLAKIAVAHGTTWELLARINHLDPKRLRYGTNIKVVHGPFFAVVTKKTFNMDVYLGGLPGEKGSLYVMSFPVGLGKDDSTPTGLWAIGPHAKLRHPTYYPPEGGDPIGADDPRNPLGGYWIALTGIDGAAVGRTSYGIHGTIDQDSIGHQASMGCIRLRNDDISLVFDLMVEGKSKVLVRP